MLIDIVESPIRSKRLRATIRVKDGTLKYVDFGYAAGKTYIDHGDEKLRDLYRARHINNIKERAAIQNLAATPATLSYYLLWGDSKSLGDNVRALNKLWADKYGEK